VKICETTPEVTSHPIGFGLNFRPQIMQALIFNSLFMAVFFQSESFLLLRE
jgi:hypothetical protein